MPWRGPILPHLSASLAAIALRKFLARPLGRQRMQPEIDHDPHAAANVARCHLIFFSTQPSHGRKPWCLLMLIYSFIQHRQIWLSWRVKSFKLVFLTFDCGFPSDFVGSKPRCTPVQTTGKRLLWESAKSTLWRNNICNCWCPLVMSK